MVGPRAIRAATDITAMRASKQAVLSQPLSLFPLKAGLQLQQRLTNLGKHGGLYLNLLDHLTARR